MTEIVSVNIAGYDVVVATSVASELLDVLTEAGVGIGRFEVVGRTDSSQLRLWVDSPHETALKIDSLIDSELSEYEGLKHATVIGV